MRNVLCFAFFLPATLLAQSGIDHWEAVVLDGSTWSYLIPTEQPDANWLLSEFDDSEWFEGNSGFGYGDDDDETASSKNADESHNSEPPAKLRKAG